MRITVTDLGDARIRIPDRITRGDLIMVYAIISHPMDTGFFRDHDGNPIPAFFIRDVDVTYSESRVARFEWTSGVSRDPFISFPLRTDREGPLTMTWKDNRGGVFTQSVDIRFASA